LGSADAMSRRPSHKRGSFVVQRHCTSCACLPYGSRPMGSWCAPHENAHDLSALLGRGDLKSLEGGYSIQEGPDGQTSILWDGRLENATLLPDLISTALIRRQAQLQFAGIIREIQRRAAQRARVVTLAPAP